MSLELTTDVDLAERFHITVEKLHELRKKHDWPHVRLGRFEVRFTDLQVEQIVAAMTVTPSRSVTDLSGLTSRSASRRRSS